MKAQLSASWRRKGRFEVIGFGTTLTAEVRAPQEAAKTRPLLGWQALQNSREWKISGFVESFFFFGGGFSLKQRFCKFVSS